MSGHAKSAKPLELKIGARVRLVGDHSYRGERGTITNTPGKLFFGWSVRLDSGLVVGASSMQMQKGRAA